MKFLEPILLACWLMGIIMIQFHQRTNVFLKKGDYLGLLPNFHLFSPKPFKGTYLVQYKVIDHSLGTPVIHMETLSYWGKSGLIDANQKIIKCVNNLCKSAVDRPELSNTNFALLLNFIKKDAKAKIGTGKGEIQFFILIAYNGEENLKFNSRVYDL
jgi:hypothetical protein